METTVKGVRVDNPYYDYLYARGYLISRQEYVVKNNWQKLHCRDLYVTYDSKTNCSCKESGENFVILLGTVMDTLSWHMDVDKVLDIVLSYIERKDYDSFYDYIDWLGGRYIVIIGNGNKELLIQDATGMRSAYYHEYECLIASHYGIIKDIVGSNVHPFMGRYSQIKNYSLPGDITPFLDILWLVPNHELDLNTMKVRRFWPRKEHGDVSINVAMDFISYSMRRQMEVLDSYFKGRVAMSMSGGQDSRISLAASRDVSKNILYFSVYSAQHIAMSKDPIQAQKILNGLGLDLKIIDISNVDVDKNMQQIFQKNHYHSHNRRAVKANLKSLPRDMVHVRSNMIEIIRKDSYNTQKGDGASIQKLFYSNMLDDEMCRKIFDEFSYRNEFENGLYNYPIGDMLQWEYRSGEFVNCACLLETDWCFDTYMLINVRKILEYGLSIPRYFKLNHRIPFELKKRMWPETMFYIPNSNLSLLDYYSMHASGRVEMLTSESNAPSGVIQAMATSPSCVNCENLYSKIDKYSATIGFSHSVVTKGESVRFDKEITVIDGGVYNLQLDLFVERTLEPYSAEYIIMVNNKEVYRSDLNKMTGMENQVNIFSSYLAKEKIIVSIQLVSAEERLFKKGIPGILHIRNMNFVKSSYELGETDVAVISTQELVLQSS